MIDGLNLTPSWQAIDARKPLFELEALPWGAGPTALWSNYGGPEQGSGLVTLRYVSQAAQTEPGLTPAALVKLMSKVIPVGSEADLMYVSANIALSKHLCWRMGF